MFNFIKKIYFLILAFSIVYQYQCALVSNNEGSIHSFFVDDLERGESENTPKNIENPNVQIRINDPTYKYAFLNSSRSRYSKTKEANEQPSVEIITGSSIRIIPRGVSGVIKSFLNSSKNQAEITEKDIKEINMGNDDIEEPNMDQQFMQAVKRVVTPITVNTGNNRKIVRIQSIIPKPISSVNELDNPPPHENVAKMARFIVRNSNWTSIATTSTQSPIVGYPFANVFSVSDGPLDEESSGIPYFYLTPLEISVKDLQQDSRASLTMSLAQGDYCRIHLYDPEDPRCAHVILTGNVLEINNATTEAGFARKALFSRHPEMPTWPKDHGWFFAKLNISHILVLDYFGGAKSVTPEDYFNEN